MAVEETKLRDEFAKHAMSAVIAETRHVEGLREAAGEQFHKRSYAAIASAAYRYADAMMQARATPTEAE